MTSAKAKSREVLNPFQGRLSFGGDLDGEIRLVLSRAICKNRKGLSVEQIADGMTAAIGKPVSRHVLRNYCSHAPAHASHRFPLSWTVAFCQVTGEQSLLEALLQQFNLPMPKRGDAERLRLAEAMVEAHARTKEAEGLMFSALRRNLV
jgi:hypothetical protein